MLGECPNLPMEFELPSGDGSWQHPNDWALRADRMPHIWCAGCGIGIVVNAFIAALTQIKMDLNRLAVVSGIGCTGRVAGYMNVDCFHTTHGRAIPFATGLHLAKPDMEVVVVSGDGDLAAIGGNHLIHAARRNVDLTVICVNNFNYGMTGGQAGPTTHLGARTTTTPRGAVEEPFNLPLLVGAAGASYVSRWTVADPGRLRNSVVEAFGVRGFAFIEVIAPCPTNFGRHNKLGEAVDEITQYRRRSVLRNFAPLDELGLTLEGPIAVGKFIERTKPALWDRLQSTR